jgi:hypothetical protein
MTKRLRYNSQAVIDQAVAGADSRTFDALSNVFRSQCFERFQDIKDNIENWQEVIANESILQGRLQTIAEKDPSTWTENNLKDMALICNILWNVEEIEDPDE